MRRAPFVLLLLLRGCGPSIAIEGDDDDDPAERPSMAGDMYSACSSVSDCRPLEFCIFPRGHDGAREEGYCSAACAAPGNPSTCDPAPGGSAEVSCLDIGIADGREVCALDCGSGRSCPGGMRCEGLATPGGDRYVCF
jgi:hypothetical protein